MHDLSTSIGRNTWLVALIEAFDSADQHWAPVSARMIADFEQHLRENLRPNASASRLFH